MGNSWEGMVIEQILRGLDARGIPYTPYHYRTKGGSEIDLILEGRFGTIPIEIKYTSQVKGTASRHPKPSVTTANCRWASSSITTIKSAGIRKK